MTETKHLTVLFLGPQTSPVFRHLLEHEQKVSATTDPINAHYVKQNRIDIAVSHGYRHIIKPDTLQVLPNRFINLHISLLPWNRGADPNLWSFLEDTPKGVTIHHIDKGIDTGDIITQQETRLGETGTLATTYQELQEAITTLFVDTWPAIKHNTSQRTPQTGTGSTHKTRDKEPYLHLLTKGWDTPVEPLIGKALQSR